MKGNMGMLVLVFAIILVAGFAFVMGSITGKAENLERALEAKIEAYDNGFFHGRHSVGYVIVANPDGTYEIEQHDRLTSSITYRVTLNPADNDTFRIPVFWLQDGSDPKFNKYEPPEE